MSVAMGRASVACLVAGAWLAGGCGSSGPGPIPEAPSYAADVQPILLQHCVRCHGAGGTLNIDPNSSLDYPPPNGYFDHYEDQGDCAPGDGGIVPGTCKQGAMSLAPSIKVYVTTDDFIQMPPPPAPLLSARDQAIISRWADETPPRP